jgi:hypothetical protein
MLMVMNKFIESAPSTTWDLFVIPQALAGTLWLWNKPAHSPNSTLVNIPQESYTNCHALMSVWHLVRVLGCDINDLQGWTFAGHRFENLPAQQPLLIQIFPFPIPANECIVELHWKPVSVGHPMQGTFQGTLQGQGLNFSGLADAEAPADRAVVSTSGSGNLSAEDEFRIRSMATDWLGIIQVERQMSVIRKQMDGVLGRLSALNRDLNPGESTAADSMDKRDWQDARRWLRDAATNVSRYIREYDVGITSSAGIRNRLLNYYKEYVEPKQSFPELLAAQKEFESFRKSVQTLMGTMQSAIANATRDGENRARTILNRIASKARAKKSH